MDAFEKLLLVSNMSNGAANDKFIYGFISGFMCCIIILMFIIVVSGRYNISHDVINAVGYGGEHMYAYGAVGVPRQADLYRLRPAISGNLLGFESFINYA